MICRLGSRFINKLSDGCEPEFLKLWCLICVNCCAWRRGAGDSLRRQFSTLELCNLRPNRGYAPLMIARREWTRQWWNNTSDNYEVVTSNAVLDELSKGEHPKKEQCLELMKEIPLVAVEPEIVAIVQAFIHHQVMPANPVGDALHLALASFHKCDFLLTWNCRHLTNADKFVTSDE